MLITLFPSANVLRLSGAGDGRDTCKVLAGALRNMFGFEEILSLSGRAGVCLFTNTWSLLT